MLYDKPWSSHPDCQQAHKATHLCVKLALPCQHRQTAVTTQLCSQPIISSSHTTNTAQARHTNNSTRRRAQNSRGRSRGLWPAAAKKRQKYGVRVGAGKPSSTHNTTGAGVPAAARPHTACQKQQHKHHHVPTIQETVRHERGGSTRVMHAGCLCMQQQQRRPKTRC